MADVVSNIDLSPLTDKVSSVATNNLSIAGIVALIFKIAVPLAGAALLVLLLFGGITYLTSAGNDDQIQKAKKIMTSAIIGIIIVAFSFGIGLWIINILGISSSIKTATNTNSTQAPTAQLAAHTNTPNSTIKVACKQGSANCTKTVIFNTNQPPSTTLQTASINKYIQAQSITDGTDLNTNTTVYPNNQTTGVGGINNTSTVVNTNTGTINNTGIQSQDCAWYKEVLDFVGLAKCPSSTSPTTTGSNNSTLSGQTPTTAPTIIQEATIQNGGSTELSVGVPYTLTITAPGYQTCTIDTTITSTNKILWANLSQDTTHACSSTFLDNLVPTSGTVNVTTLDSSTYKPVSNSFININDQTNPAKQYLKGETKNGWTSFNIDQPGLRTVMITSSGYSYCTNNIYLSAGVNVTLFVTPLSNPYKVATPTDCQPNLTTPPPTSPVPTSDNNSSNTGIDTPSTSNLPQPATGTTNQSTLPGQTSNNTTFSGQTPTSAL